MPVVGLGYINFYGVTGLIPTLGRLCTFLTLPNNSQCDKLCHLFKRMRFKALEAFLDSENLRNGNVSLRHTVKIFLSGSVMRVRGNSNSI